MITKNGLIIDGPKRAPKATFLFAHGAGAPMDSAWMHDMAEKISSSDIQVVRFEFPYMTERRESGKKRPPNTQGVLLESWADLIRLYKDRKKLFIGGKSMGGRMASLIADQHKEVRGLICLGFPFHAPGKPIGERVAHLKELKTKTLVIQGTRDTMGTKAEVSRLKLSPKIKFQWIEDGDHGFKPRKSSGHTLTEHIDSAAQAVVEFIN